MSHPSGDSLIWCHGALRPLAECRISPMDAGFTLGAGVFETLLAHDGEPFAFGRHHTRLCRSADAFGFSVPSAEDVLHACRVVARASGQAVARLRITVTAGEGPPGATLGPGPSTLVVVAVPAPVFAHPARLATVPWRRSVTSALNGIKSTSYGENVLALAAARRAGADEALVLNSDGHLCEGSGSNVFFILDGRLFTPPVESGCLPGITRGLVLDLCQKIGIPVHQENTGPAALLAASEAFLTSSTRGIHPVSALDDQPFPHCPGPITRQLLDAWAMLRAAGND